MLRAEGPQRSQCSGRPLGCLWGAGVRTVPAAPSLPCAPSQVSPVPQSILCSPQLIKVPPNRLAKHLCVWIKLLAASIGGQAENWCCTVDDGFGSGTWGEMILGLLGLSLENDSIMQGANWGKAGLRFLWLSPPSTIRPHWGRGGCSPRFVLSEMELQKWGSAQQ